MLNNLQPLSETRTTEPPKSLTIWILDILSTLKVRLDGYRKTSIQEYDPNYDIWAEKHVDVYDYINIIVKAAFEGNSYPDEAINLLDHMGVDHDVSVAITIEALDAVFYLIAELFSSVTLDAFSKFQYGVNPNGSIIITIPVALLGDKQC